MLGGFEQMFGMMGGSQNFRAQLRCYSMTYFPRADTPRINAMNHGGNILLPNSSLDHLTRLNVQYPLLFKISGLSLEHQRFTHAGVLEFLAEEGKCYLPCWMMRQLGFVEGELAAIEYRSLPLATYAKFKPMSPDFLNISNPRAILEVELRKFRCLTKNDRISIAYNDQELQFKVMDLKPQNAVSITECDVNLEFDTPEGYVEPIARTSSMNEMPEPPPVQVAKPAGWKAFCGYANRLDGKISTFGTNETKAETAPIESQPPVNTEISVVGNIVADENYKPGVLKFIRYNYKNRAVLLRELKEKAEGKSGTSKFGSSMTQAPFTGSGFTIRS